MNIKSFAASAFIAIGLAAPASATTFTLDDSTRCGAGNASNSITIGDVTGNAGGANECWGTFDGNDPGPSGDGFEIDGMVYDFLVKEEGGIEGNDYVGLEVTSIGATSGTWEFTKSEVGSDFLIVLKAASKPGYAAWLFDGAAAASTSGTFSVAWGNALSHLSIYKKDDGGGGNPPPIPLPAAGWMLMAGLGGLAAMRRRKKP